MGVEIPGIQACPTLRGKRATKALHRFIAQLEQQRGREFTDKQTMVLIKITEALISSIQQSRGGKR